MRVFACAASIAVLTATPALAQKTPSINAEDLDGDSITIGIGAGAVPSYEGSDDTVISVVPGIRGRVSGINFTLRGNRFWADLVPTGGGPGWDFQAGPVVQVNFNRNSRIVDPQVKALGKRSVAVEAGGFVGIARQGVFTSDYDKLGVSLLFAHDVTGTHGSYVITPSIDYSTPLSTKTFVGIGVSSDYIGSGYADTYFSVDAAGSAASGLPVFAADKGWKDLTVSGYGAVSLTGDLTRGLALIAGGSYRRLFNDPGASPIVRIAGSRNQWVGMAGLAYTF